MLLGAQWAPVFGWLGIGVRDLGISSGCAVCSRVARRREVDGEVLTFIVAEAVLRARCVGSREAF